MSIKLIAASGRLCRLPEICCLLVEVIREGSAVEMTRRIVTIVFTFFLLITGSIAPVYAVNKSLQKLDSKKPGERAKAVQAIAQANDKDAGKTLAGRLGTEKDPGVRAQIAGALGTIQYKESISDLAKLAKEDSVADVRAVSCLSLGVLGDKTAVDTLQNILQNESENDNVRISAASALTRYLDVVSVAPVMEAVIKGNNTVLKFGLVNSLRGSLKSPVARSLLNAAAQDTDEDVRVMSQELLKEKQ